MRILKLIPFVAAIAFAACKKEKTNSTTETENCTVVRGASSGTIIDGQYIVAYNPGTGSRTSAKSMEALGVSILEQHDIRSSALQSSFGGDMGGFVAKLTSDEANELRNDPSISFVEPDRIVALGSCFTVVAPSLVTWNITRVGYGDGTGKTAWVLDTGIDFDHPDLNVDVNRSRSFVTNVTSADDENGHGTHVAGIIGAKNNTIGVLGVASGANLVSLKVLDKDGMGKLSYIIQALAYINNNAKAGDVVNMSLGEDVTSDVLDQQVQSTANRGILIAIAAGNDGKQASQFSPGRANGQNIFTVSAVDSLNNFASFSNYGNDAVDYAAPGVRILSTYKDGKYARMSGTSMAAPHVAGLLLLNGRNLHSSGTALNDPDGAPDPIAMK
ncbi:MAG TPA: S8 family serine peptidase [Chitinophagaceae bacterium]|nr:S8 family serine peptidase [Chitinophagaceae bacterium]